MLQGQGLNASKSLFPSLLLPQLRNLPGTELAGLTSKQRRQLLYPRSGSGALSFVTRESLWSSLEGSVRVPLRVLQGVRERLYKHIAIL